MKALIFIFLILSILSFIYLYKIIKNIIIFFKPSCKEKKFNFLSFFLSLLIIALSFNLKTPLLIYLLHFLIFTLITDLIWALVKKVFLKNDKSRIYKIIFILKTFCIIPFITLMAVSFYAEKNMNRIERTEYNLSSGKIKKDYKIILLSDIHWGSVQNPNAFINAMDKINNEDADLIILAGDITDEKTSKKQMHEIFKLLSSLKSRYGIFYVYGNHDRQPYSKTPFFTNQELDFAISENKIVILQDYAIQIAEDLVIAGREDFSMNAVEKRQDISKLLTGFNENCYTIVVDHQPKDYEAVKKAKADLLLSGHTHSGQIFPGGKIMKALGLPVYGKYSDGSFSAIVSSGLAGWGYTFRTEGKCEYCVINIKAE